jgi:hypothetical protein
MGAVRNGFDPNVGSGRAPQQNFVELAAAAFGEYASSAGRGARPGHPISGYEAAFDLGFSNSIFTLS